MIKIVGSVHRSFTFPADLATTCAYYSDFNRILSCLPHVQIVDRYGPNQFRMVYHTTELGLYSVRLYCDLQAQIDRKRHVLHMIPLPGIPPAKLWAAMNTLVAQGYYASESVFCDEGDHTRIDYTLKLGATLPKPFGLNLVPDAILDHIATNITDWRIHEIAEGFIARTIDDFTSGDTCIRLREKSMPAAMSVAQPQVEIQN